MSFRDFSKLLAITILTLQEVTHNILKQVFVPFSHKMFNILFKHTKLQWKLVNPYVLFVELTIT